MRVGSEVHKSWTNGFCTLVPDMCCSSVKTQLRITLPASRISGGSQISGNLQTLVLACMLISSSFSILSDDRIKTSSKTIPPHRAIQSFLLQMRVSSPGWWLHLIVVRRFKYASDPESYTSGSVATGRAYLAGQVKGQASDEERHQN